LHFDGLAALCARVAQVVHCGMIGDALGYLTRVSVLSVNFKPRSAGAERVMRDNADA
jgi:hypothetical protein